MRESATTPLLFWDVDTQVDFLQPEGKLYVPGSKEILGNLARLTELARERGLPVVASADDHHPEDAEISDEPDFATTYPPHCMHGTRGAEKVAETTFEDAVVIGHRALEAEALRSALGDPARLVLLKKTTDVFANPNTETVLELLRPERIVVYGVALDVCNRRAVEGLLDRGFRDLAVVTDATEAIDGDAGEALLEDWRRRSVELVRTADIVG